MTTYERMRTRNQIIATAMLYFGIEQYRFQEGYSEFILYNLAIKVADRLEGTGCYADAIDKGDFRTESVQGVVDDIINGETK